MQSQRETPRLRRQPRRTINLTPNALTTTVSVGAVALIIALVFFADWMQVPNLSVSSANQFLSPNNDGSYDIFTVNYHIDNGAKITALVYADSKLIRSLSNAQAQSAGDHFISWDGRNDVGAIAADGFYRIEITAGGAMRSTTQSTQAQLDTQPPTVQLANLPEGSNVNKPDLVIEGVTEAGALVLLKGNTQPQKVDNMGRFTFQQKLADGSNSIELQAVDPAGNVAKVKRTVLLVTQPPDIVLTRPLENEWTNQQILTIEGNTRPGATLTINQQPVRVDQEGHFLHELILADGDNSIRFIATDAVGNIATLDRVVHVKTGSVPIQVNIQDGATIGDANFQLTGKVDPGSLVTVNGAAVPVNALGDFQTSAFLATGDNAIVIEARDLAGNTTKLSRNVKYAPNGGGNELARVSQNVNNLPSVILPSVFVMAGILAFIYLRQNRVDLALSIDQPTFTPGLPSEEKTMLIMLDLSKTARVSLEVLDQNGYARTTILHNRRKMGRRHVFHWNGYDDRGTLLPPGEYTIRAEAGAPPLQATSSVQARLERPFQFQIQTPVQTRTNTISNSR